ncbi:MAG: DUF1592 domain-containing protein, partial [Rubripirellula sp.]|nr:DUF1592 domain-containing protein [Rubripirellula sp.]
LFSICLPEVGAPLKADEPTRMMISELFEEKVKPLLFKFCGECHGATPIDNDLDLTKFSSTEAILARPKVINHVAERLRAGDMPPVDALQPSQAEREQLLNWMMMALDVEAAARAGDPGPVTLRRLSNTEYDNAIRDLTGVDMLPTKAREFPVDSVGGEGFANVGDAMPMTPELVQRYHQTARDVAARAVLLPDGFRFSHSTDQPIWTAEALAALRSFHGRYADANGEPPLESHLAATLRHRDRLMGGDLNEIVAVAAEENLNATYLAKLWIGLTSTTPTSLTAAEVGRRIHSWEEKVAKVDAKKLRQKNGAEKISTIWNSSKRILAESQVAEGASVPFEEKVTVARGELLLMTVLPNANHGADSTLVDWTIREIEGEQRSWSVSDLIPDLLKGNAWVDHHEARWSFLETASAPSFLTEHRDSIQGHSVLKSWSRGSEPSVFVNTGAEELRVWTTLPPQTFFVHPGHNRPVAVAWTSPIAGELLVSGRVADAHPAGLDGVAFELSHLAAADLGQALVEVNSETTALPDPGMHPAPLDLIRRKWREATTDPAPVLEAIKETQNQLFRGNYKKNAVIAVGNGFPAWEEINRVVARETIQSAAREPIFRLVALPPHSKTTAQLETYVVWDRLRLEGGDGGTLVLAEHPELKRAVEAACGIQFGQHPEKRDVPKTALVTVAGEELVIDLSALPAGLQTSLTLPRFLCADVSLDEGSPETAEVQAFLIAAKGGGGTHAEPVAEAIAGNPRVARIVHPRVAEELARSADEFRALFPPAVLFAPIIPRDAQGSLFLYHREDEPLRRLLLDEHERAELDRLWSELDFVSEQAFATPRMYEEIQQYYRAPNDGARIMFFYIQLFGQQVKQEEEALRAGKVAAETTHLQALVQFAARAWRRTLADEEVAEILAGYHADRESGMKHDPAFRRTLVRILSSPWFLYRVEQPAAGSRWQPISGEELATRLSFLLWDSIPDEELRLKSSRLHETGIMEQQVHRMLKDDRVRGMAREFGARWLGVRDFVTNHGRNLKQFPEFTPELIHALAEEPVRLFEDSLVKNRPIAELIDTDAVVINDILANHYGIPGITGSHWRRVENVSSYGRGGLLGFGSVLAKTAAASRTSPVKRGAWVVQMLGEQLPKVPPGVPPLPEELPEGLSVRELTERHQKDPACANCHVRIDPYGMTLEQFDALGRLRPTADLKPGDTAATTRDGVDIDGFEGLRDYLANARREDVLRTLARKLTGYSLGRAVQLSDRELVNYLTKIMVDGGRWSDALLLLVNSEQFRCIRPQANSPQAKASDASIRPLAATP